MENKMKATDFAYYLQGFFEITGGANALTETQAKNLFKKAESVEAGGGAEAKAQAFVDYTKGILFAADQGLADPSYLSAATNNLRTKLNDLFVHAIDPSYAGDQTQFGQIHKPKPNAPGNDGPPYVVRC
jgi:hypothetical protein